MANLNQLNLGGQNNTLQDLLTLIQNQSQGTPQVGTSNISPMPQQNRLGNLAQLLMATQANNPLQSTAPRMITAGGQVLGRDVSKPSGFQNVMGGLNGLAQGYLMQQQQQKQGQFFKSINDIMGANAPVEDKKQKVLQLIMQNQGNDYGLGIKDVLIKELGQPDMPVYKTDASGNLVQVGKVPKGAKVMSQNQGQGDINYPKDLQPLSANATPEEKDAFLSQLDPVIAQDIKGLSDYTLDPMKLTSYRGNQRLQMAGLAKMYNPNFDMKKFVANQAYLKNVTQGKIYENVTSLNTLAAHLDTLDKAVEQVKLTNQPLANAVIISARNLTGDPTITDYKTAKEVVDNEVQRALTGVGVTQEGIARQGGVLPSGKAGYSQLKQYVKSLAHIMSQRLSVTESEYKQRMGQSSNGLITLPETQSFFDKQFGITNPVQLATQGKTVVNTGTYNGKKVVQYSDGSVDYQAQ